MVNQDSDLGAFVLRLGQLGEEGERLIHDPSLGLDERAIVQRALGYILEARQALQELATPTA